MICGSWSRSWVKDRGFRWRIAAVSSSHVGVLRARPPRNDLEGVIGSTIVVTAIINRCSLRSACRCLFHILFLLFSQTRSNQPIPLALILHALLHLHLAASSSQWCTARPTARHRKSVTIPNSPLRALIGNLARVTYDPGPFTSLRLLIVWNLTTWSALSHKDERVI